VISKGAAQSWQMENRHKTMLAGHFEHGFAVEWNAQGPGHLPSTKRGATGASLAMGP